MRKKRTNPPKKAPKLTVADSPPIDNSKPESLNSPKENGVNAIIASPGPSESSDKAGVELVNAKSASQTAYLIPRPDGHGALLSGGQVGNKGGGRTPDAIRGTIRQIIDKHGLPFLEAALSATNTVTCPHCKGEVAVSADPKLMAKLLDTGLRIGVGPQVQVEHQGVVVIVDADSLSV